MIGEEKHPGQWRGALLETLSGCFESATIG